jgi:hypothetical protein
MNGHFSAVMRIRSSIKFRTGDTCVALSGEEGGEGLGEAGLAPTSNAPNGRPWANWMNSRCAQIVTKYTPPPA